LTASILPCTFRPGEGELLSSWLVRLAQAHYIKVESFCRYLWPQVVVWKRDVDKVPPSPMLDVLAARTLTSSARILQMTLAPVCERLTGMPLTSGRGHTTWIMPLSIHHRTHQGNGLAYCPHCLQRDGSSPYYRTVWRLAFHIVCPTCAIQLLDSCPACGAPVSFFRLDIGRKNAPVDQLLSTCYKCAFDLCQAPVRSVSAQSLAQYQSLYRISREGWNQAVPYSHQYFQVLRQLVRILSCPFGQAVILQADMRLRIGQPMDSSTGGGAFEQMPITRRALLLEQAMWLLEEWPNRFIRVMDKAQMKSYAILRDASGQVPHWFNSVVIEHFYNTNASRHLMSR
jgi:hypothetical protein